jgi:predicted nucleic acid-binding protein
MSVHSIAEMYTSLTRMPVEPRIHPSEAARTIADNLLPHFETVPVGKKDYLEALATVERGGWGGAKTYDALILNCASKCDTDRIYTFNLSDFQMLAAVTMRDRICAP